MKTWTFLFLILGLMACQDKGSAPESSETDARDTSELVDPGAPEPTTSVAMAPQSHQHTPSPYDHLRGSYVGFFEAKTYDASQDISWANRITVFIDSIVGEKLYGHSVVAGNERPFVGNFNAQENAHHQANGREPGDDRYDGEFFFNLPNDGQTISGTWKAYNRLPVSEREFELERRTFRYDPNQDLNFEVTYANLYGHFDEETGEAEMVTEDAIRFNASARRLKKAEVENLYGGDLEVIRNAIYARHGYSFKNRRMRYLFDSYVEWYMPVSTDIRDQLTEIEKANIDLLKRYEEHADRYYDVFGR